MSKLVISLRGGMGSRVITLLSARVLARHVGCEVEFYWPPDFDECSCAVEDLFEDWSSLSQPVDSASPGFHLEDSLAQFMDVIETHLAQGETVYFSTWFFELRPTSMTKKDFNERMCQEAAKLRPVAEVLKLVQKIPSRTIGFHIRREDHWRNLRYSPLSLFIQIMERHCKRNPEATFLLATDSNGVGQILRQRFGTRLLSLERDQHRDSPEGVQAALADILTLAQTDRLYGCNTSCFAQLVHFLSRSPRLLVALPNSPTDFAADPRDLRHDALMVWDQQKHAWRRTPKLSLFQFGFEGFRYWIWNKFILSDLYQRWPFHRVHLFACTKGTRKNRGRESGSLANAGGL